MVCDATTHSPLRDTATLVASLTTIAAVAAVAAVMSAAPAAAATGATPVIGQEPDVAVFLGDFGEGWQDAWTRRDFTHGQRNRYRPRDEGNDRVLQVRSEGSAGGMVHPFEHAPVPAGTLVWRWKVAGTIAANAAERSKKGDDFAARLLVVFETHWLPWKNRALCYVWAAQEPEGAVFASPHSDDVGTIVLRSGDVEAGRWIEERRDVVADYRAYFGREPERISAVAVMVDTDDTGATATAWFDDLVFIFAESPP